MLRRIGIFRMKGGSLKKLPPTLPLFFLIFSGVFSAKQFFLIVTAAAAAASRVLLHFKNELMGTKASLERNIDLVQIDEFFVFEPNKYGMGFALYDTRFRKNGLDEKADVRTIQIPVAGHLWCTHAQQETLKSHCVTYSF